MKPNIFLIGMGLGNPEILTSRGKDIIQEADFVIGAKRILESLKELIHGEIFESYDSQKILEQILSKNGEKSIIAAVFSGDTGFYSGAEKLSQKLSENNLDFEIIPGISSLQYFAAKIRRSWQNWNLASCHGTDCDFLSEIAHSKESFFLLGGKITVQTITEELKDRDFTGKIIIAKDLSLPTEETYELKMENGKWKVENFHLSPFTSTLSSFNSSLSVCLVENENFDENRNLWGKGALPDHAFIREEKIPMTKQLVRSAILSIMELKDGDTVWDIGAGTGAVSIDFSRACKCSVFSIEEKENAFLLEKQNRKKFGAVNIKLVHGLAPKALENLPKPEAVFVGGSEGNLSEILNIIEEKNPNARIVVSAVTIETFSECQRLFEEKNWDFEVSQISVSNSKKLGSYHLMKAENPIWLFKKY